MPISSIFQQVWSELQKGMNLSRCRKCGCMKETLENLKSSLPLLKHKEARSLQEAVVVWLGQLEPLEYPCFGCKYCIPPEAMTKLTAEHPSLASSSLAHCEMTASGNSWPPVQGEYTVLDRSAPVAVSTLASMDLEGKLARQKPAGLCIVGKTETENIGIDKIVKNIIANHNIRFLILAGKEPAGHQSGDTLLSLWENGVNDAMRVIGSKGRRPVLKNVSRDEVTAFRNQVRVENMIGCDTVKKLTSKINELSLSTHPVKTGIPLQVNSRGCGCKGSCDQPGGPVISPVTSPPKLLAKKHRRSEIKLDKAGYFVIFPSKRKKTITVEHYSYENKLMRTIEGKNSRDIYLTIVSNRWVQDLGHAAYLGKELARAELSIRKGFKFIQDGA